MAYTSIGASRVDADSPVDEDLTQDLADNDQNLFDHAVRTGSAATGRRSVIAYGRKTGSISLDGSGNGSDTNTITFSTDCRGGENPNFGEAPVCLGLVFEESSVAGDEVGSPTSIIVALNEGGASSTIAFVITTIRGGTTGATINYYINWSFIGAVTGGE